MKIGDRIRLTSSFASFYKNGDGSKLEKWDISKEEAYKPGDELIVYNSWGDNIIGASKNGTRKGLYTILMKEEYELVEDIDIPCNIEDIPKNCKLRKFLENE